MYTLMLQFREPPRDLSHSSCVARQLSSAFSSEKPRWNCGSLARDSWSPAGLLCPPLSCRGGAEGSAAGCRLPQRGAAGVALVVASCSPLTLLLSLPLPPAAPGGGLADQPEAPEKLSISRPCPVVLCQ